MQSQKNTYLHQIIIMTKALLDDIRDANSCDST